MGKEKSIIVPIDYSACAENALLYALKLSTKQDAKVIVLHTPSMKISQVNNDLSSSAMIEEQLAIAKRRLRKYVNLFVTKHQNEFDFSNSIDSLVQFGATDMTISDLAKSKGAHLIVMGTQGENSTLDRYLGSTTSNVVKNADCPVLVIPEGAKYTDDVAMGYATDFSPADAYEVWKAVKLLSASNPTIKCVHFGESSEETAEKMGNMKEYLSETLPMHDLQYHIIPPNDQAKDLAAFIESEGIDVVVMYSPKRSFFDSLFHRSYTQKMAKHVSIPLLVCKEGW